MSEWKCPKCGQLNTGKVGGVMSFGGSFSSDMSRLQGAAEKAQKICASCGADRTSVQQKSSGCFIATAAYGSSLEPEIICLKDFRDRFLLKHKSGTAFVSTYELLSPPIANFIQKRTFLRFLVRKFIVGPLVKIIKIFSLGGKNELV